MPRAGGRRTGKYKYIPKSRKGKYYRRRLKRLRIRSKKAVYYYTRNVDFGNIVTDGLTPYFNTLNFSLSDLPNNAEFTSLYDMYKINAVKLTFIPKITQSVSTSGVNNPLNYARVFTAIDYNDGASPTSVDELREYQTVKWTNLLRTHKRFIYKPKILDTSSYSVAPWMATLAPGANYFGLKVAIEPTGSVMTYGVEAKYYLGFKNVK